MLMAELAKKVQPSRDAFFVVHVVGELTDRGYATRAERPATWADVEALRDTL
jgi:hypothetical protein